MTTPPEQTHKRITWQEKAAKALTRTGVLASRPVHANLAPPALVAESLRRREGRLSADGALMAETGVHTGRSPRDKFVVDEPSVTNDIWWGNVNQKMAPATFNALKGRVQAYLQGQELFVQDLYAGADPAYRIKVRLVTTQAWNALFARNMFIRPPAEELASFEPDYIILHAPLFQTDPAIDNVRSSTTVAMSSIGGFSMHRANGLRSRCHGTPTFAWHRTQTSPPPGHAAIGIPQQSISTTSTPGELPQDRHQNTPLLRIYATAKLRNCLTGRGEEPRGFALQTGQHHTLNRVLGGGDWGRGTNNRAGGPGKTPYHRPKSIDARYARALYVLSLRVWS